MMQDGVILRVDCKKTGNYQNLYQTGDFHKPRGISTLYTDSERDNMKDVRLCTRSPRLANQCTAREIFRICEAVDGSVDELLRNLRNHSRGCGVAQVVVTQIQEEETETPRYEPLTSPFGSEFTTSSENSYRLEPSSYSPSEYQQVSASGSFGSSELDDTPLLTPESLVTDFALLSPTSKNAELAYGYAYDYNTSKEKDKKMGICKCKRARNPSDFDVLLADISNDADGPDALLASGDPNADENLLAEDDKDEWYGLEYTLALSTRERRASDTHSFSAGEHSKSRESWAAIHQGTIHPFFEDEEYYEWKNWHRYLDRPW
ncbi:hypothetical protein B0H13DRAFT_2674727 [Mycena leptocephala]|nr:hypothetical protein B0H13DRAFT_2674726 [Mycena leptocephala]KAJ7849314.1 hypothetical protein B0H13DRAFT_2674727 [Mycena leptocephala]